MAIVFRFECASYRSNFAPELPGPSAMVGALSSHDLNVALIAGGFDAWAAAGKTVVKFGQPVFD